MKRLFCMAVWVCLTTVSGRAQQPFKRELAFGFGGGVTLSSVGFTPKVDQGLLLGRQGGLVVRWITEEHLGLIAELNYAQQGWKEDFYSRTLNYIELPFLTHLYFGRKRVRFFVNAGPKIGYMPSESTDENLNGNQPNRTNEQHGMAVENKFDWGLCGGPGLELRTGIGSFLLESRYYFALGNIYGNSKKDFFPKSSPQVISVKLGYLFTVR
ncbi:hypothetical protein Barb4_02515 [Bacteroidales bacterium Barb4]|nr:hypothetical protein Barb4_02515 [Bacteroidales bacterium Barb4]